MREYLVFNRRSGVILGAYRALNEDQAISSMLADAGVSSYEADPDLVAEESNVPLNIKN